MVEKLVRRAPHQRSSRRLFAAAWLDPPGFEQRIHRALGDGDPANVFDLGTGHRLVVGDDRHGLHGRPAQPPAGDAFEREIPGEVRGGAEGPGLTGLLQHDAAVGVVRLQRGQDRLDVLPFGQLCCEQGDGHRLLGGEQQSLDQAQGIEVAQAPLSSWSNARPSGVRR